MMISQVKQKCVVVQLTQPLVPEYGGAIGLSSSVYTSNLAVTANAASASIKVRLEELDGDEQDDIRRDPTTLAVVGNMPLKLIEPTNTAAASNIAASDVWGIEAVGATQSSYDGTGITVAILDTGIDPNHPAFSDIELIRKNFTQEGDDDTHGHGTHCAGTVFGSDVGGVRIGVARGVRKAIIGKVLGSGGGGSVSIVEAIQWAMSEGANIISMSLGIDFPGYVAYLESLDIPTEPATSVALEEYRANLNLFNQIAGLVRAQQLFGKSGIVVAATGNESERPQYHVGVAPPASATGIIAVGAAAKEENNYKVARFSNTKADVVAPGVDVYSAALGGGLVSMSGTSMATPHAAGVAALWAQMLQERYGTLNASMLEAELIASGDISKFATPIKATDIGSGMVKAPN